MVENIVYSFSQGVSLSTSNFALTGIGGTTSAPNVALASNSDGTVWTVTFTGAGVNNATKSIGDGEYELVLSGVTGLDRTAATYDFFRLLGDMDGNGVVDSADFSIFISTFLRATTRSRHTSERTTSTATTPSTRPTSRSSCRTSCTRCRTRPG